MSANFDQSPALLSAAVGAGFGGFVVVVLAVSAATLGVLPGVVGAVLIAVGVYRGSRLLIVLGSGGMFAGIVLNGAVGMDPVVVLIALIAAVLAWDASQNAVTVGLRLGRAAETRRLEVVHIATTGIVTTLAAGGGYVATQISGKTHSPFALVALLLAVVALAVAFRG